MDVPPTPLLEVVEAFEGPPLSASEVLNADENQIHEWSESLNIDDRMFGNTASYQVAILESLVGKADFEPAESTFSSLVHLFQKTVEKRRPFQDLLNCLEEFTTSPQNREILMKLKVAEISSWLDETMWGDTKFEELRQKFLAKKPSLLFAGCTSAGKSTVLNTLLGDSYLPVTYNAGTAVVCEIMYSETGKRYARVCMRDGRSKKVDLETISGRQKFAKYVNRDRSHVAFAESSQSESTCVKTEIFLPLEFLQYFTLVDSPGVTEDLLESESTVRQATENFQKHYACGLVYILDATRPAEDSGQIGGLLKKMARSFPTPKAAVFVLNKWDRCSKEGDYLESLKKRISCLWRGFKPEQLCTMNAKLAFAAQQTGATTSDVKSVCETIARILPIGMDALVMRNMRPVQNLVSAIKSALEYSISMIEDSTSIESAGNIPRSPRALELHRRAVQLKTAFKSKLENVTSSVAKSLLAKPGVERGLPGYQKQLFIAFRPKQIRTIVKSSFRSDVHRSVENQQFYDWLQEEFEPEVENLLREFQVTAGVEPKRASMLLDDKAENLRFSIPQSIVLIAAIIGFIVLIGIQISAYIRLGLLLVLLCLSANFFYPIVDSCYKAFIRRICAHGGQELQELLNEEVILKCPTVAALTRWISCRIQELDRFSGPANQSPEDLQQLKAVLKNFHEVRSKMSELILGLQMHEFDELNDEIKFATEVQSLDSGSLISAKPIYKTVCLALSESCDDLLHTLQFCKALRHPNLVCFLGSALQSLKPPKICFVIENFPFGTLADKIYQNETSMESMSVMSLQEANSIVRQMWDGLNYLHILGVAHGNLTLEHIIITENKLVKINCLHRAGLLGNATTGTSSLPLSADVYNMGIILWELWNRKKHALSCSNLEEWVGIPKVAGEWKAFAQRCLDLEIRNRPSAEEGYKYFKAMEQRSHSGR
eukprot:m.11794 g.11794  ORF g.11794 m.11794 type:complete len:942 (+) comp23603_c0_seq4:860-3685(+)